MPVVDEILSQRLPGHTLPGASYHDPAIFHADLERIWYREWIFIAHTGEIATPGSFLTTSIGHHPIVVIRRADGNIGALHNVCRHRGSLICTEPAGMAKHRLVCPYHQWSYALDGSLAHARGTGDQFDPSAHALGRVHCEVTAGMIFVSLAEEPPDFGPMKSMADAYFERYDLGHARIAAQSVIVEAGNWKLLMENNRECHHCRGAHPQLSKTFPEDAVASGGPTDEPSEGLDQMVREGETHGLPSRFAGSADHQFRAMRMPLKPGTSSMTIDGTPAVGCRFGDLPDIDLGDLLLYHYPSTWNHYQADHAVTFRLLPLSPTETQLTTTWLVPANAMEGVDYDLANLTQVWESTNAQDKALVERTQVGVTSPAFTPGPYAPVDELGVIQFVDWYLDRMSGQSVSVSIA